MDGSINFVISDSQCYMQFGNTANTKTLTSIKFQRIVIKSFNAPFRKKTTHTGQLKNGVGEAIETIKADPLL